MGRTEAEQQNWGSRAACLGADPTIFFPPSTAASAAQAAKAVCSSCPVKRECRTDAMEHPELDGVRGGLTDRERVTLRSRRADRFPGA